MGESCITNWGSFVLLQIGTAYLLQNGAGVITNWGKLYHKLGQLLQVGVIITIWGITPTHNIKIYDKYFSPPTDCFLKIEEWRETTVVSSTLVYKVSMASL